MKIKKNSAENLLKEIVKLESTEFLGVCKILGIKLYEEDLEVSNIKNVEEIEEGGQAKGQVDVNITPKKFEDIWCELCDKVEGLNRTRRRNLGQLVYAATKKEKE